MVGECVLGINFVALVLELPPSLLGALARHFKLSARRISIKLHDFTLQSDDLVAFAVSMGRDNYAGDRQPDY